jgi:hypothetical protein
MKKQIVENKKKQGTEIDGKMISRKEAIKKTGYMAVSAATMMLLLSSPAVANGPHASEPAPCPGTQKPNNGGGIWKKK